MSQLPVKDDPQEGTARYIRLRIGGVDDEPLIFQVKPSTVLQKVFEKYKATRSISTARFVDPEGRRLKEQQTVAEAGLEDDDKIEVFVETIGGC
jgi:hypothetical protein